MARGLVLSIVKKSCKKIVARCTIGVHTVSKRKNLASTGSNIIPNNYPLCLYIGVNRKNRNYVLTTAKMFTEIDGRSLRTAEEERLEREKELKKTEFQRKKSFFESESATDHSSTPTDNKSGMYM